MKMKARFNWVHCLAGVLAVSGVGLLGGCKGAEPELGPSPTTVKPMPKLDFLTGLPGTKADMSTDKTKVAQLVMNQDVRPRHDPFSLSPQEIAFDRSQTSERLLQENGNMSDYYVPPPPPNDTPPATEPQPYRRVSGIIVGDSVLAIIEMGDNKVEIIRPGEFVTGTEWWVVSIDEEKVVLRRKGKVQPTEITVRLEQKAPGSGGGGAPGPDGGGGAPPAKNGKNAPGLSHAGA